MTLRGRRIKKFVDLWCLVASRGLDIWVSLTSFQKGNIDRSQQPPTERVSEISKKLDFWWSILQKWTSISHFGVRNQEAPEVVEASWFMKLKCPNLLKPLGSINEENYWSFYPSEPFRIIHFNMRHPVE